MSKKKIIEYLKAIGIWAAGSIGVVVITALLKGEDLKGLTYLAKAKYLFHLSMPLWLGFLIGSVALWALWLLAPLRKVKSELASSNNEIEAIRSRNTQLVQDKARLGERLNEFTSKVPRLHGVWNNAQAFWHLGRKGAEPGMQIGGWIDLTLSNTNDPIILLAAYIGDQRSDIFPDIRLEPGRVNREMVMLFMVPPLSMEDTKPFTATVVVEDQFNRQYELPRQEFRATPVPAKATTELTPPPINLALGTTSDVDLSFDTLDHLALRIQRYEHQDIKGLTLRVDNNRLDPIQQTRVIWTPTFSISALLNPSVAEGGGNPHPNCRDVGHPRKRPMINR